jgi:biotin operon repressor
MKRHQQEMVFKLSDHERELMSAQCLQEFLAIELRFRCLRNAKYSVRAMARDLDIQVSRLSVILRGKTSFSEVSIEKIAGKHLWQKPVVDFFKNLAKAALYDKHNPNSEYLLEARKIRIKYAYISVEGDHRMIEQWELSTFALALLLKTQGELLSDENLAKKLGISEEKLSSIIGNLEALGWLERKGSGRKVKVRYLELGNRGSAYHIRSIHRRSLDQALWSIDNLPTEKRHYYSTFFSLHPSRYEALTETIRTFVLAASEDQASSEPNQEIYHLGTFLIPLTQPH